ncbi:hypothetical protein CNZ80_17545 [Salmonella enterica]|nr:hypothetical protein [Salmonella enterica]
MAHQSGLSAQKGGRQTLTECHVKQPELPYEHKMANLRVAIFTRYGRTVAVQHLFSLWQIQYRQRGFLTLADIATYLE